MRSKIQPVPNRFLRWLAALAAAGALLLGCPGGGGGGGTPANPPPGGAHPKILEVRPPSAAPYAMIEIHGIGLGSTKEVFMGGVKALSVTWDDTKVYAWVPNGITSATIELVTARGTVSSDKLFTLKADSPKVASFSPTEGAVHSEVTLYGSRLDTVKRVIIGGADAPIHEASDGELKTSVPPAAQTGRIEVVAGSEQVPAPGEFTVKAAGSETLTLFKPPHGPPGTKVVLTGTGLGTILDVRFNGVPAPHSPGTDTRIETVVPAGASTGRITLITPQYRTIRSLTDFKVTSNHLAPPAIQSISPESGPANTRVEIHGAGFDGVDKAFLGDQKLNFYKWYDTKLVVWIPSNGAVSAPITLSSQSGTSHSKTFKVTIAPPAITDFLPVKGGPGTPVIIRGERFNDLEWVRFGSGIAAAPLKATPTELKVLVPPGATTGPIQVKTRGGSINSAGTFTVASGDFASRPTLRIEAAYITQSVQRMDGTVPLVAGRDGLLRVFLQSNLANASTPSVRASILDSHGTPVLREEIPATQSGVPTEIHEMVLDESWNLAIPGSALEPGNTLLVELVPDPTDTSVDIPVRTFPPTGAPRSLDIRPVPPLRITLFPVRSGGAEGNVDRDGRSAQSWLTRIRQFYPVKDVEVKVGAPFSAPVKLLKDFTGYVELRDALEFKRLEEDKNSLRYWYGVFRLPEDADVTGLGMFGLPGSNKKRSAIGWDGSGDPDGQNCFSTFAHELGHNLSRYHAPCGIQDTGDLDFKHPGGDIGVYGMDVPAGKIKNPGTYKDVMGYCYPRWVSDYTYEAVMDFRAWELKAGAVPEEVHGAAPADSDAAASLVVWGAIDEGRVTWRPSFTSAQSAEKVAPGDYTLECLDAHGRPLTHPVSFAADAIPDLPTRRDYRSFVFRIPMTPAMLARPFTLHVRKGGHRLPEDSPFPSGAAAHRIGPARDPVATRAKDSGLVTLTWEDHPGVIVKDPRTHEILAIARGGSVDLETDADQLECVFSIAPGPAGERSLVQKVSVGAAH